MKTKHFLKDKWWIHCTHFELVTLVIRLLKQRQCQTQPYAYEYA
jgi:hypothetical protein